MRLPLILFSCPMRSGSAPVEKEKATQASQATNAPALPQPEPQGPTMETGTKLLNRFVVDTQLGAGGFGQIYLVKDTQTSKDYVLKWQSCTESRRIKLEMTVLLQLRGRKHIPVIFASGMHKERGFIIIQLLGKNLGDWRRAMPTRKFTDGTVYRVAQQMCTALQDLHEIGYLHRDVKPQNMCVGAKDKTRIYLIDFGMARNYTTVSGRVRKARDIVGFRGTLRYASIQVHRKFEQGPAGDLASLVYSLVEMATGTLPWAKAKEANEFEQIKKATKLDTLCEKMAKAFRDFAGEIWVYDYEDMPRYESLQKRLNDCFWDGFDHNDLYDWEYVEAEQKVFPSGKKPMPKKMTKATQQTADYDEVLPGLLVVEPNKVLLTRGKSGELVKFKLENKSDVTLAFRISTSRAFLMSKPHYGFIQGKCSVSIMAGSSSNKADKLGSEKQKQMTIFGAPQQLLPEEFHVHFGIVNCPINDQDPRDLIKDCQIKGMHKVLVEYQGGSKEGS